MKLILELKYGHRNNTIVKELNMQGYQDEMRL